MALQNTWALNYTTKSLYYVSGTAVDTVMDLYKWIQDQMDEQNQMDDTIPMKYDTPTEYQLINGWTIPENDYHYLKGGSIIVNKDSGNDVYANIYSLGTVESGTQLYVSQSGSVISPWWPTGHIDILTKVMSSGTLINSGNLIVFGRELSDKYDHYAFSATGGRNAVPLATENDLSNQTDVSTIATYNDITITFGTVSKNLNNGNGARNYDVVIDCATRPLSQVYEYLKYITRRGSETLINGVQGQLYRSANSSYTEVKASPFGTYLGGTFFGARGIWIENYDASDAKSFQLTDAAGVTQSPPNIVPVKVTSVVSGDKVAIFRLDAVGGSILKEEYTYNLAGSSGTTFAVNETIKSDTPTSGTIRIGTQVLTYESWSGSVFTLSTSADPFTNSQTCYVPLLDCESSSTTAQTTLTYNDDIPVLIRVRKYGILPFEVESTVTNVGLSVAAIRNTDTIVS